MDWFTELKNWWWLAGIAGYIIYKFFKMSVLLNKSKESIEKVSDHDKDITALKKDLTGIKNAVERQANDTAAILLGLQSIMNCLYNSDEGIGPARDEFTKYLSNRRL